MPQIQVNLKANKTADQGVSGTYVVLLDTGTAGVLELSLYNGNRELEKIRTARRGFKARTTEPITRVFLTSAVDTTVELVVSDGTVDIDGTDGANVTASIADLPLPVRNDRGTPATPMHVVGVSLSDAPGTAIVDGTAVAVNETLDLICAADANARDLRITNHGPDPMAIGGAGLTWAKRVIVLEAGDTWQETKGANLAWYGITETAGKTASANHQRVNA